MLLKVKCQVVEEFAEAILVITDCASFFDLLTLLNKFRYSRVLDRDFRVLLLLINPKQVS